MDIKTLSQSNPFRIAIVTTGVLLVAFLSFSVGVNVGLRKAKFSYAFGENYERNFGAGPLGTGGGKMMDGRGMKPPFGADDRGFRNGHGLIGEVMSVTDDSVVIGDIFGNENTIAVDKETIVKNGHARSEVAALQRGDRVAIIGEPNEESGRVEAHFIRVLPVLEKE